jgi:hypothetical protein
LVLAGWAEDAVERPAPAEGVGSTDARIGSGFSFDLSTVHTLPKIGVPKCPAVLVCTVDFLQPPEKWLHV